MPPEDRKYVRVYYSVIGDERFADVFHDARRLGTWLQLLLVADAMYPADAPIPAYIHRPSMKLIVAAGLVEERPHQHYCVHGLASERGMRSQTGRNAAAMRWQSDRTANPMPSKDEHRQDKTSNARAMRKPFADPLLEQIRTAQLATYGVDGPIVPEPTRLLTAAEQEREAHRLEALALHERFRRGDLGAAEYERLRADVGKPDDDLTRLHA